MTLEEVIAKARREWQSAHNEALAKAGHAPDNRIQPSDDVIANAVRAFLGSEEVVERVARGLLSHRGCGGPPNGDFAAVQFGLIALGDARAALSSIGGE